MYICSHPQVLLHLHVMFVIFVVLYVVSNKLYELGLNVSGGPSYLLVFSRAWWLVFRIAFMITHMMVSKRVFRTLLICANLATGACSSIIIFGLYDSYRWWYYMYYWYSEISSSSVLDEGPWSSTVLYRVGRLLKLSGTFLFHSRNTHLILLTLLHL